MKHHFPSILIAAACVLIAGTGQAVIPHQINYQGMLTTPEGELLDGPHDLVFRIYESHDVITPLWEETHAGVALEGGLFNVILGEDLALSPDLFADDTRYLGITVDDGEEILPRLKLTSVPYAHRSAVADTSLGVDWTAIGSMPDGFADGIDDTGGGGDGHSLDADDGDPVDALYVDNQGRVGIGTTSPTEALVVGHSAGYDADAVRIVVGETDPDGAPGLTMYEDWQNYGYISWSNAADRLHIGTRKAGVARTSLYLDGGLVGINTEDVSEASVTIDGSIAPFDDGLRIYNAGDAAVTAYEPVSAGLYTLGGLIGVSLNAQAAYGVFASNCGEVAGYFDGDNDQEYAMEVYNGGASTPGLYVSGYAVVTGGTSAVVQTDKGPQLVSGVTSPGADVLASGTARLDAGQCRVEFDEIFADVVSLEVPLKITVTPSGRWSGLYVSDRSSQGFTVRAETGALDVDFDWTAIGRRRGAEQPRVAHLPSESEREKEAAQMRREAGLR